MARPVILDRRSNALRSESAFRPGLVERGIQLSHHMIHLNLEKGPVNTFEFFIRQAVELRVQEWTQFFGIECSERSAHGVNSATLHPRPQLTAYTFTSHPSR